MYIIVYTAIVIYEEIQAGLELAALKRRHTVAGGKYRVVVSSGSSTPPGSTPKQRASKS